MRASGTTDFINPAEAASEAYAEYQASVKALVPSTEFAFVTYVNFDTDGEFSSALSIS